jgi:hypothetical protein
MPSKNPRLALTVPPALKQALDELAEAQGIPTAKVVVGLLAEMETQIRDLAKYARLVRAGETAAAKRSLQHMFGNALAEVMQDQLPLETKKKTRRD